MSVNDLVDTAEKIAIEALFAAKAVSECRVHGAISRTGDGLAERKAYAIATNMAKARGMHFLIEDVVQAVDAQLTQAGDDGCSKCFAD